MSKRKHQGSANPVGDAKLPSLKPYVPCNACTYGQLLVCGLCNGSVSGNLQKMAKCACGDVKISLVADAKSSNSANAAPTHDHGHTFMHVGHPTQAQVQLWIEKCPFLKVNHVNQREPTAMVTNYSQWLLQRQAHLERIEPYRLSRQELEQQVAQKKRAQAKGNNKTWTLADLGL
jgi:hypothetical protein